MVNVGYLYMETGQPLVAWWNYKNMQICSQIDIFQTILFLISEFLTVISLLGTLISQFFGQAVLSEFLSVISLLGTVILIPELVIVISLLAILRSVLVIVISPL